MHDILWDGRGTICPECGGKIKHPYTGLVTSEQLDEDFETCQWVEVIDESKSTIGYDVECKNLHPYTKPDDKGHTYYDVVEFLNCDKSMSLDEKVNFIYKLASLRVDNPKEKLNIITDGKDKIKEIRLIESIKEITLNLSLTEDGKFTLS